jgi:hypothetical protein
MTEKEIKFKADLSQLILRAIRAGATMESIQLVMNDIDRELFAVKPYVNAFLEKDMGP